VGVERAVIPVDDLSAAIERFEAEANAIVGRSVMLRL
jgi:hypothetical protein